MAFGAIERLLRGWYYYRYGLWVSLWTLNNFCIVDMGWRRIEGVALTAILGGWIAYLILLGGAKGRPRWLVFKEVSTEKIRLNGAYVFFPWLLWATIWGVFLSDLTTILTLVLTPFFVMILMGFVGGRKCENQPRSTVSEEADSPAPETSKQLAVDTRRSIWAQVVRWIATILHVGAILLAFAIIAYNHLHPGRVLTGVGIIIGATVVLIAIWNTPRQTPARTMLGLYLERKRLEEQLRISRLKREIEDPAPP